MQLRFIPLALWLAAAAVSPGQTPSPAPEDPAHAELRAAKSELIAAIEKGDIDAMLTHLHPDVTLTWQDGQVCRGTAEVKAFFEKMRAGQGPTFQAYKVPPTPDSLSTLHAGGMVATVTGHNTGQYHMMGRDIDLPNRWTATLVKKDGKWLLAAYHVSMNVLDNPLLAAVKKGGMIAGGVGIGLGALLGFFFGRKNAKAAA